MRSLNSSPHPKKYSQGLPEPIRPQRDRPPDQHPQAEREQQNQDRRPRGRALASGPGAVQWTMPPPPTPPQRERAVPLHDGLPAHQILQRRRNGIPSLPRVFLGVTIGYLVWRALGSVSERQDVGLGTP